MLSSLSAVLPMQLMVAPVSQIIDLQDESGGVFVASDSFALSLGESSGAGLLLLGVPPGLVITLAILLLL